jgi:hypothetical protein
MSFSKSHVSTGLKPADVLFFLLGVLILIGTWKILYEIELTFTERHLAGYYCCATEQDLPKPGTLERTLSDLFKASPGKHLSSLAFVLISAAVFVSAVRRARDHFLLPLVFICFNVLYFTACLLLLNFSWTVSDWINGPRTSVYTGYERTWIGIVVHFGFWVLFFKAMYVVSLATTMGTSTE